MDSPPLGPSTGLLVRLECDVTPPLPARSMDYPDLDAFFKPSSIAVVGASRRPDTIGYQVVDNLVRHGYTGVVYPVNPKARAIHSVPAYPSVAAIPGDVDLAIIV